MLIAEAVIELTDHAGFAGWPSTRAAGFGHLPLHAGLTAEEIGSVVWSFLEANHVFDDPDADGATVLGGVRITDTKSGAVLVPGCCSDLSGRFDLFESVADGTSDPWLGHSPSPDVRISGNKVRFVIDAERTEEVAFEATLDEFRTALDSIEGDLLGFIATLEQWAPVHVPAQADDVVARFRHGIGTLDLADRRRGDA
ncbi:hypothetical protein [Promicromonospora sp. NPDC023805]|uniref:hypothetical protein n=1 Tax=Promicromonospora sp. NPDC023805 TaxID=3154696 RepID=UPI0033E60C05